MAIAVTSARQGDRASKIVVSSPTELVMITQAERYYTPEEYLALEETAESKSEYHDGEIVPMTGGTTNHNEIALNFCTNFRFTLRRQNTRIYMGDVRLWIPRYRRGHGAVGSRQPVSCPCYTYPDAMVIEGEPIYEGTGTTTVTNPCLIVEVLSDSTKNYDRGDKFQFYRSIAEFREYILVDQYRFRVEQFTKQSEGQWLFTEYEGDAILPLKTLNQISFSDLYEGVEFASEPQSNPNQKFASEE